MVTLGVRLGVAVGETSLITVDSLITVVSLTEVSVDGDGVMKVVFEGIVKSK